jgi:hypothetical protein
MSLEGPESRTRVDIPKDHLPVPTGAHNTVSLQPYGVNWALMPAKGAPQLKCCAVPDLDERIL